MLVALSQDIPEAYQGVKPVLDLIKVQEIIYNGLIGRFSNLKLASIRCGIQLPSSKHSCCGHLRSFGRIRKQQADFTSNPCN